MSDYIYLLENRLSPAQRSALRNTREVARSKGLTIFLVGGAVRDLTSGSPVRDLDVVVQGSAPKLKKEMEKAGALVTGELDATQAMFLRFPGGVRMELGSTLTVTYPKPGKAIAKPASILEDLRRRDFTANAMALSLNDGSYGLLMDPLNGVADIENRQLRLVSNYGFIEDPIRMVRAARLMARLGWTLDEKTEARYQTGREEGYVSAMPEFQRGYELEEIVHEEDPLRILKRLEADGWMKVLAPFWSSAKVNVPELERLRELQTQLELQGIHPATAAANFPLLTAKLSPKEVTSLKASFPRQGFVAEIDGLETQAKEFAALLTGKGAASPSQAWKLFTAAGPEVVLWSVFSSKSPALQAKFKSFSSEWPQARQKMPYTMMQEMRIVPELPGYEDLLEKLFFELMDGNLATPEEMKAFLEPYSPPAPPPPVSLRRQRAPKKEARPSKSRSKKSAKAEASDEEDALESTVAEDKGEAAPGSEEQVAKPAARTNPPAAEPAVQSGEKPAAKIVPEKTLLEKPAPAKTDASKAAAPAPPPAKSSAAEAGAKADAIETESKKATKAPVSLAKAVAPKAPVAAKVPAKKQAGKTAPAAKKAAPAKAASAVKKADAGKPAPPPARKAAAAVAPQPAAKKSAKKSAPVKSTRRK